MKLHLTIVLCLCSILSIPANSTPDIQGYFTTSFRLPSVSFILNRVGRFLWAPFIHRVPHSSQRPVVSFEPFHSHQSQHYVGHSQHLPEFGGWYDHSSHPQQYQQVIHHPPQPYSVYSGDYQDYSDPYDVTYPPHQPDFHGWGWDPPKKKESTCKPVRDRVIRGPDDLEPTWTLRRVNRDKQVEVNPNLVLNPPKEPVPTPFPSITADKPSPFKSEFQQTIKLNLLDSSVDVKNVTSNEGDASNSSSISTANPSATTELPGSDEIEGTLTIYKLPRLSAPIRGKYDRKKYFEEGLNNSISARSRNETSSPLQNFIENDLKFMEDLFKQLRDFKPPPEDAQSEESLVEMPQVISRVERRAIPEPDHSERTVLDFEFNFGLPVVSYQFESPSEIMKEFKRKRLRRKFMKADRNSLVSSQRFRELVGDAIRRNLSQQIKIGGNVFVAAEGRVQESYSINQYVVCTIPTCDDCKIDPIFTGNMLVNFRSGSRTRRKNTLSNSILSNDG